MKLPFDAVPGLEKLGVLKRPLAALLLLFLASYCLAGLRIDWTAKYWDECRYVGKVLMPCVLGFFLVTWFDLKKDLLIRQVKTLSLLTVSALLTLWAVHDVVFFQHVKLIIYIALAECCVAAVWRLNVRAIFFINALNGIILAVLNFYLLYKGRIWLPGEQINVNVFAGIAVLVGTVAVCALLYRRFAIVERIVYPLIGLVMWYLALRTGSRTALATEILLTFVIVFYAVRIYGIRWWLAALGCVAVLVSVAVCVMLNEYLLRKIGVVSSDVKGFLSLTQGQTTGTSVGLRLAMWEVALTEIFPKYPFFGVGDMRHFPIEHFVNRLGIDPSFVVKHFHNEAINFLAKGGLVRLLAAVFTIGLLVRQARRRPVMVCMLAVALLWGITEVFFAQVRTLVAFASLWCLFDLADEG